MRIGDPVVVELPSFRSLGLGLVWKLTRRRVFVAWLAPRFDGDAGACVQRRHVRHEWREPEIT